MRADGGRVQSGKETVGKRDLHALRWQVSRSESTGPGRARVRLAAGRCTLGSVLIGRLLVLSRQLERDEFVRLYDKQELERSEPITVARRR